ncbi:MAG: cupin domain-containing protein [Anaerolineales bacterium]
MKSFDLAQIENRAFEHGQPYFEFLRSPSLSMGLYRLPEGASDPQSPHKQDEVYYVLSGNAKLQINGETLPALPGAIFFVEAGAPHKFIEIKNFLELLVFFAPPEES